MEAVSTLIHIRFRICTTEWWSLADFTEESDMLMSAVAFFTNTQHDITSLALVVKMCKYNSWLLQEVRSGAERDCCLLILAQQYEGNNDATPGVAHILQQRRSWKKAEKPGRCLNHSRCACVGVCIEDCVWKLQPRYLTSVQRCWQQNKWKWTGVLQRRFPSPTVQL